MGVAELLFLSVGLSMDAFAVAVCIGLSIGKPDIRKAFVVGLYFGVFQAGMPFLGYFAAAVFSDFAAAYSDWLAFGLLAFLGAKMLADGLKKDGGEAEKKERPLGPAAMLPLAVATSIDALAVGVSLAFLQADILRAAPMIGATTFLLSAAGAAAGAVFGAKLGDKAQVAGGLILLAIGIRILIF